MSAHPIHRSAWFTVVMLLIGGPQFGLSARADDGDERNPRPVIREVIVEFGNPAFGNSDTLTIIGGGFDFNERKRQLSVMLGEQGPLEVLSNSETKIIAHCFVDNSAAGKPDFECDAGDYRLSVAIVKNRKSRDHDYDDDRKSNGNDKYERDGRVAFYDLTIGAVGPQGMQGQKGDEGPPGLSGLSSLSGDVMTVGRGGTNCSFTSCPDPKKVLSGGWELYSFSGCDSDAASHGLSVRVSVPQPEVYIICANLYSGSPCSSVQVRPDIVCANVN